MRTVNYCDARNDYGTAEGVPAKARAEGVPHLVATEEVRVVFEKPL